MSIGYNIVGNVSITVSSIVAADIAAKIVRSSYEIATSDIIIISLFIHDIQRAIDGVSQGKSAIDASIEALLLLQKDVSACSYFMLFLLTTPNHIYLVSFRLFHLYLIN